MNTNNEFDVQNVSCKRRMAKCLIVGSFTFNEKNLEGYSKIVAVWGSVSGEMVKWSRTPYKIMLEDVEVNDDDDDEEYVSSKICVGYSWKWKWKLHRRNCSCRI